MVPLVLTREQVRRVDAIAIERYGISGLVLMENAGRGAVEAVLGFDAALGEGAGPGGRAPRLAGDAATRADYPVAVLCGKGNNAGDGFVIARHLEIRGVAVRVMLLAAASELAGDALANYAILQRCDVPIFDVSHGDVAAQLDEHAGGAVWLVDALLGTGAMGEPREPFATAIRWMNAQPARRLAIDVPSGLDCDSGVAAAAAVRADLTVTFAAAKPGLLVPQAAAYVGELSIADIGLPPRLVREAAGV
ncbi:NAD(P)H-hydrate epimerase [Lacipirellula parvula]|uniref:NAD(P)H-hydrate epimerase n=1 Tax=Lacipirellula parvula TaxID=2650471 RepID=A0A5K7XG17_9BACT|nr:NAD(P)H-hydrate epimerase [Lacipirellula parvula]BBO35345.1 NADPH-hydrate epimerase [Lacipirellula parvula]